MQSVALGVYLTLSTHDALWLGLLTLAAWLPALLGSPLGGVMSDRVHRQRWIQLNNAVMATTATILAWAAITHHLTPALACYLAVAEGLCGSASWAAWQSLLPDLVDTGEVLAAVSLSSTQFNMGRIIGPLLAGVALAAGSPQICFVLNAASFVVVIVMFAFVQAEERPRNTSKVQIFSELAQGARVAWRVPGCRNPIISIGAIALIISPFITLIPAMAIDVLHAGKAGTSWLVTAQGVGAVVGGLTLPALAKRTSRLMVLRLSWWLLATAELGYALAPNLPVATGVLFLLGFAYLGTLTGLNTSVQLHAPINERSRILSLYTLSLSLFYPLGAVFQSALARSWGVRYISELAAALMLGILAALSALRPQWWRAMGPTDQA